MNLDALVSAGSGIPRDDLRPLLASLNERDLLLLRWRLGWLNKARPKQLPPIGDWLIWFLMTGRGFGKTLCGGEWLAWEAAHDPWGDTDNISHVIAPTHGDLLGTCFEGPTGLLNTVPPGIIMDWNRSEAKLYLDNGGMIRGFTATEPERLRGPQCRRAWCEEIGAWQYDEATWDMMMLGLRLGDKPQVAVTSTPKPRSLVQRLVKHDRCVTVRGSIYENKANLPDSFLQELEKYEGTKLGRQELHGELIDLEEMGIVARSQFRLWSASKLLPEFSYVVMSLDTAFTERTLDKDTFEADPTACVVFGVFVERTITVDRHGKDSTTVGLPAVLMLDAWQDYLGLPALIKRVKEELKRTYGPATKPEISPTFGPARLRTDGRKVDLVLIEDKGSGISLRQQLETDGIVAHPYNPGRTDKIGRLHVVSALWPRGRIWVPESPKMPGQPRSWCEPVINQLCTFHGEGSIRHDDFVDATTQALRVMMDHGILAAEDVDARRKRAECELDSKIAGTVYKDDEPVYGHVNGSSEALVNPYAN